MEYIARPWVQVHALSNWRNDEGVTEDYRTIVDYLQEFYGTSEKVPVW